MARRAAAIKARRKIAIYTNSLREDEDITQTAEASFPFLALPPEIRNIIYKHLLEDDSPYEMDLLKVKEYHPKPHITAVSSQLRDESLGLYDDAAARFCKNRSFFIRRPAPLIRRCRNAANSALCLQIQQMTLWPERDAADNFEHFIVDIRTRPFGGLEWNLIFGPNTGVESEFLASLSEDMTANMTQMYEDRTCFSVYDIKGLMLAFDTHP